MVLLFYWYEKKKEMLPNMNDVQKMSYRNVDQRITTFIINVVKEMNQNMLKLQQTKNKNDWIVSAQCV